MPFYWIDIHVYLSSHHSNHCVILHENRTTIRWRWIVGQSHINHILSSGRKYWNPAYLFLFFFSDDLLTLLSPEYPNLVVSELVVEGEQCYSHGRIKRQHDDACLSEGDNNHLIYQFGRQFSLKSGLSIKDYSVFYVGQEGATLRNFMMTWNRCSFCTFDPVKMTGRTESVSINRALMKRYYAIERAKDAKVVGILVGTLGVVDYLDIIQQLKETIRGAGKKSYMFAMGKLNVPKLANFLEIDIFRVGCVSWELTAGLQGVL